MKSLADGVHIQKAAMLASVALAYAAHKDDVPDAPPFPRTRREYYSIVDGAVHGYLLNGRRSHKNVMKRGVIEKFPDAFYRGYSEAGGDDTETDDERWLTDKSNAELVNIDSLFETLKDTRDAGEFDAEAIAEARAEGYTTTLDAVYAEGKLRGAKNKMLTWRLGETEKHCKTCSKLNGKRYSAKKWLQLGHKPRDPGNETLECGGWKCDCRWETDDGKEYIA